LRLAVRLVRRAKPTMLNPNEMASLLEGLLLKRINATTGVKTAYMPVINPEFVAVVNSIPPTCRASAAKDTKPVRTLNPVSFGLDMTIIKGRARENLMNMN